MNLRWVRVIYFFTISLGGYNESKSWTKFCHTHQRLLNEHSLMAMTKQFVNLYCKLDNVSAICHLKGFDHNMPRRLTGGRHYHISEAEF